MNSKRSTWAMAVVTLAVFAALLGVPFAMRPPSARLENPLELVIVSPHDEAVKIEFERAFSDWHQAKFGRPVRLVVMNLGGGGDIRRFVESKFAPQFREVLGKSPANKVRWAWVDQQVARASAPATAPEPATAPDELTARAIKLAKASADIDILFGGGDVEHNLYKDNGWIARYDLPADCDFLPVLNRALSQPDDATPRLGGQNLCDPDHYWYGAVLSRVGLLINRVVCRKLHIEEPATWADLADPQFRDQLALADPNMSSSAKLCYEMVLQSNGWQKGWRILSGIAANGRYFASGSTQVALDVSRCEAAAGMIIDYYGRTQVDYVGRAADGQFRLAYVSPIGATATTPDPIAIMRGAPHRELAERFVQFVLSVEGQKLWMCKVGSAGGPRQFGLYRPPIRPDIYTRFADQLIFPENPFREPGRFNLNSKLWNRRFALLGILMRAAFIDNSDLLIRASDRARLAAADSPARKEFDALPFPEGDFGAKPPAAGTMWHWADQVGKAKREDTREAVAAELTEMFRKKYLRVLSASTLCNVKATTQAERPDREISLVPLSLWERASREAARVRASDRSAAIQALTRSRLRRDHPLPKGEGYQTNAVASTP